MMLVQSATYEGRIAAENAMGESGRELRHTIVAHGGFTDPEYGSVGLTEAAARAARPRRSSSAGSPTRTSTGPSSIGRRTGS